MFSRNNHNNMGAVHMETVMNPHASAQILAVYADDASVEIRKVIAVHPNTDIETVKRLTRSTNIEVREAAFSNSKFSLWVRFRAIQHDFYVGRDDKHPFLLASYGRGNSASRNLVKGLIAR